MKIAHINIRSLFTGFNDFTHMVQVKDYDVVMITETWLSENIDNNVINIPGYNFFRKDRKGRGGGVGAYVKSFLDVKVINFDFGVTEALEFLFININLHNKTIVTGVFYRPPNTNPNTFIPDLDNILSEVCPTSDILVCLGDFNVNFLNLNSPVLDTFESYGLAQILDEPTRITDTSSTLIDPIFINKTELIDQSGTISCEGISDHNLVYIHLNLQTNKPPPRKIKFRCFKNFNYDNFYSDLVILPWPGLFREYNIDNKIALFNKLLTDLFDKHAPLRSARVTKPKAPWMNDEFKRLKKQRDKAWQKYKRNKSDTNRDTYRALRNHVVSIARSLKKRFLMNVASENDSARTWRALTDLNIRGSRSSDLPNNLSNPQNINAYFASFLQNVSNNCNNKIDFYNNNVHNPENVFSFSLATIEDIFFCLHSIKTNAEGVDGINLKMLKLCTPHINHIILHIINSIIENNYLPTLWKTAIGIPLPKINNPQNYSDLRIISILPTISKILEKVLYKQIFNFFTKNKLLPDSQCGFRKNFGTATALTTVFDDVVKAADEGMVSVLILLDFSKAFDTLDHRLLCAKLNYYGFNSDALKLISSFLSNRSQKIIYNNSESSSISIYSGVPQGSILSPLLFIIYTIDIINSPIFCETQAYADDTQLYYSFHHLNIAQATQNINHDLEAIRSLSEQHNLKLNSSKSKVICIGTKNKRNLVKSTLQLQISNTPLNFVASARNLGLTLDEELRFSDHVKNLNKKAFGSLKLLYHNRHILTMNLKRSLCECLVLSHFTYCDFIYGPCLYERDKYRIQKAQNACCRFVFGLRKYDHISNKISECNWLNMKNRMIHHLGNFVHRSLNTPDSSNLIKKRFIPRTHVHSRNIRFKNKFTLPQHRTAMFKRSFSFNAINLYNSLPDHFKIYNINKFKFKFRDHLFDKQLNGQ